MQTLLARREASHAWLAKRRKEGAPVPNNPVIQSAPVLSASRRAATPTASANFGREQPAFTLRRLSAARWSGALCFELATGPLRMCLESGLIVWAERVDQRRNLAGFLCELLAVTPQAMSERARAWRIAGKSWVDAVIAETSLDLEQLRAALREHLREALQPITTSPVTAFRLEPAHEGMPVQQRRMTFAPEEVLSRPETSAGNQESLMQLAGRVYGVRWVDVVVDGVAAGFSAVSDADTRMLEAVDALLLNQQDGTEFVVLRGPSGTWAGSHACINETEVSTWLGFDAGLALGGVLMGLRAAIPFASAPRNLAGVPALQATPSLFPGPPTPDGYRSLLSEALALGDGALAAHVFERDAVCWGSVTSVASSINFDCLRRGNSALDLCEARNDDAPVTAGFVLLCGPQGFHVGMRVPGENRMSLFLSFAHGASYGQGVAALSVGVSALSRVATRR